MDRNLIDYLPSYLHGFREIKEIANTEQVEIENAWNCTGYAFDDQYVYTATLNGVKHIEKILGIYPTTDNLNERKNKIILRLSERLQYTTEYLKNYLTNVCGNDGFYLLIDNENYRVTVKLSNNDINKQDILDSLNRIIPCNLVREVMELNTWGIVKNANLTWEECSSITWNNIREDVL